MGNKKQVTTQKRSRKPMGVSSITNTLKKINGVLTSVNGKESITPTEKLDLQISGMYLSALKETIDSILTKGVSESSIQPTAEEVADPDDDEE